MDWGAIKIYRALNLDINESIEVLSRIYRRQKYLDGSRSCREFIGHTESFSMDWKAIETPSRRIPESSMDLNCANFCQEKKKEGHDRCKFVEDLSKSCRAWRKRVFQREEKHIEMNATSKLLKHRSNQHIKLLKKHLSTKKKKKKKCKAFIIQNTHTKQV